MPPIRWGIAAAMIAVTVLAYVPALGAPFVMDDIPAIIENGSILPSAPRGSSFTPPPDLAVSGRPVVNATLAINAMLNSKLGVDPLTAPGPRTATGFRLFNILFHLCTGALIFGVLRRAMREQVIPEDWRVLADPIAGTVCALWLLHPIQTEAIDYVVQRTELLASLFYVATLYASLRAWGSPHGKTRMRWYLAGVAAALLGVESKEIAISAPLMVMLYDRAFRLPSWRALLKPGNGRGWFYVALSVACIGAFATLSVGARSDSAGFNAGMGSLEYFYTQCWAIAHYLRLVVLPNALALDYGTKAIAGARGIPGLLLLSAFGLITLWCWTRVARWGWLAFLGSWFFILLAPSSSFVPIPSEVAAERRIYLAVLAVLVVAVVGVEWLRRRYAASVSSRKVLTGWCAIAVVLAVGTAARSNDYANSETLWRDVVAHVPENPRGYVNLGSALLRESPPKTDEAAELFARAMTLDSTCAFGCAQLARVRVGQGRLSEAEQLLERTVAQHPGNAPVERNLALVLMKMGSFDQAIPHIEHVAANYPTDEHLLVLGAAYLSVGRRDNATKTFQLAIRMRPESGARRFLSGPLEEAGRAEEARPYLKQLAITLAKGWQ